jgi:hypothetical protein
MNDCKELLVKELEYEFTIYDLDKLPRLLVKQLPSNMIRRLITKMKNERNNFGIL